MNEELINMLKMLAARGDSWTDIQVEAVAKREEVIFYEWIGGNVDDAFDLGQRSGETQLARKILLALDIRWY